LVTNSGSSPLSALQVTYTKDGGLFVPETFPKVTAEELSAMLPMSYAERAATVLYKFLDDYDFEELKTACEQAYSQFEGDDPAPLVKIDSSLYMLELFFTAPPVRSRIWRSPFYPIF